MALFAAAATIALAHRRVAQGDLGLDGEVGRVADAHLAVLSQPGEEAQLSAQGVGDAAPVESLVRVTECSPLPQTSWLVAGVCEAIDREGSSLAVAGIHRRELLGQRVLDKQLGDTVRVIGQERAELGVRAEARQVCFGESLGTRLVAGLKSDAEDVEGGLALSEEFALGHPGQLQHVAGVTFRSSSTRARCRLTASR